MTSSWQKVRFTSSFLASPFSLSSGCQAPSSFSHVSCFKAMCLCWSLLQHHSSKRSILWCPAFFIVQHSHPYMTTGKTIALTRRTFVSKVMSLVFNMLSRLVIAFIQRTKHLLMEIFSSVQFSRSVMSDSLRPHESQHTRPPCPSPTPGVHPDSRPSSQ